MKAKVPRGASLGGMVLVAFGLRGARGVAARKGAKSRVGGRSRPAPKDSTRPGGRDRESQAVRLAKALSHPLRSKLLVALGEETASPSELAARFGEPLQNVSYHVQVLLETGCIELVDTAPRRGAVEHYYHATTRALVDDDAWEKLPRRARREFVLDWFRRSSADLAQAIDNGGLERRTDVHFSFTPLDLNEDAWAELSEGLRDLLHRAFELQAESATLREEDGVPTTPAGLVMVQYEQPRRKRKR